MYKRDFNTTAFIKARIAQSVKHQARNLKVVCSSATVCKNFYAPGLKGPPGASSNRIVRLFVRLSVIPSRLRDILNI